MSNLQKPAPKLKANENIGKKSLVIMLTLGIYHSDLFTWHIATQKNMIGEIQLSSCPVLQKAATVLSILASSYSYPVGAENLALDLHSVLVKLLHFTVQTRPGHFLQEVFWYLFTTIEKVGSQWICARKCSRGPRVLVHSLLTLLGSQRALTPSWTQKQKG